MCDQYSKHRVDEKVDIWALGCILYTLIYKKHPFQDAQKLTIINAHYFCPETNYSEKLLDLTRLMLTPNPEKRPDIKKIIQILQNWTNITKIELSKEVEEIKAKHQENNKKSQSKYSLENLGDDELLKIQKEIMMNKASNSISVQ
jgi:serine/threonine protein kinase